MNVLGYLRVSTSLAVVGRDAKGGRRMTAGEYEADEWALADALAAAQADPRLPAWTSVRDLGWREDARRLEILTSFAPSVIADGRDHDHLRTPLEVSSARGDVVARLVERHLEEWRFLVEHASVEPVACSAFRAYSRPCGRG